MVKRKIVWTKTAFKQRREIFTYWIDRNGNTKYVEDLIYIIASHVNVIQKNPFIFKETEIKNIFESAMGHFSLYYTVKAKEIVILAFWDNRQDPKKLIKQISKK